MSNPNHPDVEDLDRMVLILSNKQGEDRMFLETPETPEGESGLGSLAVVSRKRLDEGWFNQAWMAEQRTTDKKYGSAYALRNIRTGAYLQAVSAEGGSFVLKMAEKKGGPSGNAQSWYITSESGFARIRNVKNINLVFELFEPDDGTTPKVLLKENHPSDKESQTWKYERVSRSAADVEAAMKSNKHMPDKPVEYEKVDACYINLPPIVRQKIWEDSGLGKPPLKWRREIFDCDDFAFAAKTAVSRWAARVLVADGFTILFGITFGKRGEGDKVESHAYNWYLDWNDLKTIAFFEPSTGHQSYDGWNYKGFSGIF